MKKIIWLSFAVLAGLWTLTISLLLRASDWMLGTIAAARLPQGSVEIPQAVSPWMDSGLMHFLQQSLLEMAQLANSILPMAGGLSAVISVVAWLFWGFVMVCLLVLAVALHWLAGRRVA